ncbi:Oidioi.mRNA.OKI2018_I69.chr2.g4461.t1.cds [Oikopleura dioica]|uniref:Oidioi.mRNA.OKI2018_I69.chr2.g4461.t1.cds n=1 Tax=Oikopleura dioica TaxID=34765 RepID=A0ABN7T1P1_OIKDI|nr:Oidioi.mRNA.OKI2018_I69.chr2.g4461.t1.cds [Oikopleura dioica]
MIVNTGTRPNPTEIDRVDARVDYDIGVGVPLGLLIISLVVDIVAAVYCFAQCGFKKVFYWAKMSSIITVQVYLHLCALLTFAAYIQQTLRLAEYPFGAENLGFGFWAIMISFLLRCLIWFMVSCCPAGCRPCLTINGDKLEELQAEAILNLVKGADDDATTINDDVNSL